MRFFHTLWTKPATMYNRCGTSNILQKSIWYYALSYLYVRKTFPNAKIVLHTDNLGANLLSDIGYDSVYTELENLYSSPYMWASGKIAALNYERCGAIHIDCDVMLIDNTLEKRFNTRADLICQSKESCLFRKELNLVRLFDNREFDEECYNCGFLIINNEELKEKFVSEYFDNVEKLINYKHIDTLMQIDSSISFDLIYEQSVLKSLSKEYKVDTLFDRNDLDYFRENGYIHFITSGKYVESTMEGIKNQVKLLDINLYNKLIRLYE